MAEEGTWGRRRKAEGRMLNAEKEVAAKVGESVLNAGGMRGDCVGIAC